MSRAKELADKLDFHYADNGSGYNSEWTRDLQDAAALLRTQDALLRQALEALENSSDIVFKNTELAHLRATAITEIERYLK